MAGPSTSCTETHHYRFSLCFCAAVYSFLFMTDFKSPPYWVKCHSCQTFHEPLVHSNDNENILPNRYSKKKKITFAGKIKGNYFTSSLFLVLLAAQTVHRGEFWEKKISLLSCHILIYWRLVRISLVSHFNTTLNTTPRSFKFQSLGNDLYQHLDGKVLSATENVHALMVDLVEFSRNIKLEI